ncbi:hypothetical protein Y1Q_0009540 [Alligator mississippiensis]|uniref:Uncharacterized protein n=1 Tax=Alligator mississippiensis TaxID=8496 RepID=A0A151NUP8_ALLMI|nr:hypothetical protein Y1Q_0009540 [Alligator mississippiensis]
MRTYVRETASCFWAPLVLGPQAKDGTTQKNFATVYRANQRWPSDVTNWLLFAASPSFPAGGDLYARLITLTSDAEA